MEIVAAGLADLVGYRSSSAAILGAVGICENNDFLNGLKVCSLKGLAADGIVVVILAVDEEVIGARPASIHRKIDSVTESHLIGIVLDPGFGENEFDGI